MLFGILRGNSIIGALMFVALLTSTLRVSAPTPIAMAGAHATRYPSLSSTTAPQKEEIPRQGILERAIASPLKPPVQCPTKAQIFFFLRLSRISQREGGWPRASVPKFPPARQKKPTSLYSHIPAFAITISNIGMAATLKVPPQDSHLSFPLPIAQISKSKRNSRSVDDGALKFSRVIDAKRKCRRQ